MRSGETNAFTAKEYTCYYARVLDADPSWPSITCDMVIDSVITDADLDTERSVILEEINMHDDHPATWCTTCSPRRSGEHPLGRPILGTVETIPR